MASKDVYTLVPRTCEYVTLYDERAFAGVTELKLLRWGHCPGSSKWAQRNYRIHKEQAGGPESEEL